MLGRARYLDVVGRAVLDDQQAVLAKDAVGLGEAGPVGLQMMDQRALEDDVGAARRQAGCGGIALSER